MVWFRNQNSDLKSKIAQVRESIVLDLLIRKICSKAYRFLGVNETKKFMIDMIVPFVLTLYLRFLFL